MAIVARIPKGFPDPAGVTWSSENLTIADDLALAAGDILLVFLTTEPESTTLEAPSPTTIPGVTSLLNGGLHPTSFTVSNLLDPSGTDLSSSADSRWIDLGYTKGGYTSTGGTIHDGRNTGSIWAKVLTTDDIFSSGTQVDVTVTLDTARGAIAKLVVVSGASTEDADLATLINIARTSMGNTRSSSGTAYDEAEWWGPNATSQVQDDPESNHHLGTATVGPSDEVIFAAEVGGFDASIARSVGSTIDLSTFAVGRVLSVSGSDTNDGLYVVSASPAPSASLIFITPLGGTPTVEEEIAGAGTVTITSGGYSSGDLGDDFLAMFFASTPPTCLPVPTSAPVATGTTRPPSVQTTGTYSTFPLNVDGTYPAGWAEGWGRTTDPYHGQSCYWDLQTSFNDFHGLWDGTVASAGNPNRFAWDYDDQDGTNVLWAYGTHLLLLKKEAAGTTAGTPVTATGSYAVTSTGTASTATGSYAVKTAGTPVTATGSYAVTSTGSPTTATGDYAVTSTGAVTATGSYAVTSTGTVATATGAYAVSTTGSAVTATGSYAVVSAGTIATATGSYAVTSTASATTATGSYAVTSAGIATTATGAYAVTSTGTVTTSTGSYAVTSTGTVTTATGSYAVTAAGTVSTATGSYAVTSTGTAVTATGSYDVDSTTGGSASATGSYAVIAAGTAVTATGAYVILLTGSPVTSTGSYAVTSTGTAITSTGSYAVLTAGSPTTSTGSYAVTSTGTAVTSTGSYAVQVVGSPVTATGSYSVTSSATSTATGSYAVTAAGTPVTATGSYEVSSSTSGTASATGSYAVTSTGTVVTATGAYSVTVSGVTTATGSYAVLVVGTPVSATGSYAIAEVTFVPVPAEVFCQYAVINMEHLGYKAFRQLATLRQRTK